MPRQSLVLTMVSILVAEAQAQSPTASELAELVYSTEPRSAPVLAQPTCDLNGDGICTCADIDFLTNAVANGSDDPQLDLNGDGIVDPKDRDFLIEDVFGIPYGDVNFDGQFDTNDLVDVFQAGLYDETYTGTPVSFCEGDWNGDGVFDSTDIVLAFRENGGPTALPNTAVPEPDGVLLVVIGIIVLAGGSRYRWANAVRSYPRVER